MHRRLINDIIRGKEEIGMAAALLQEISRDERERAILRSRRMAETDRISDLLTAEERGEIRGEAKGMAKVIILLKQGISLEEIEKTLTTKNTTFG